MKNLLAIFIVATIVFAGAGFAKAKKEWQLKGANRQEATVTLSYEYDEETLSDTDHKTAEGVAAKKCATWGRSGAELFGEIQRVCAGRSRFGKCKRWEYTVPFQCTGSSS